jgi:hypothetical protein
MAFTYPSLTEIFRTDTFDTWANKTNHIRNHSLYVEQLLGDFNNLETSNKSVVGAINENKTKADNNKSEIGDLSLLNSDFIESDLVSALNSNYAASRQYTQSEVSQEATYRIDADNELTGEIGVNRSSVGLTTAGAYIPKTSSNYITAATSIAESIDILDTTVGYTNTRLDTTQNSLGANSDGTIVLIGDYIGNDVKRSLENLDTQVRTNADDINQNALDINTLHTRLGTSFSKLGLDSNGNYVSDSNNTYAITNNLKGDVNALDTRVEGIDAELVSLGDQTTDIYVELDKKLETPPLAGNDWIVYDSNTFTYSHRTNSATSLGTSGTQVFSRIDVDSAGHISNMTTRNLGNQSLYNQTISTSAPSGGSNGDVWYRI